MDSIKFHTDYAFKEGDYVLFQGKSNASFYGYVKGWTANGLLIIKPFQHPNVMHVHRTKVYMVNHKHFTK